MQVASRNSDTSLQEQAQAKAMEAFQDSVASSKKVAVPVLPFHVLSELDGKLKGSAGGGGRHIEQVMPPPSGDAPVVEATPPSEAPTAASTKNPKLQSKSKIKDKARAAVPIPVTRSAPESHQQQQQQQGSGAAVNASEETSPLLNDATSTRAQAATEPEPIVTEDNQAQVRRKVSPLYVDVTARLNSGDETSRSILSRLDSLLGLTENDPHRSASRMPAAVVPASSSSLRAVQQIRQPNEPFCGGIFYCFSGGGVE